MLSPETGRISTTSIRLSSNTVLPKKSEVDSRVVPTGSAILKSRNGLLKPKSTSPADDDSRGMPGSKSDTKGKLVSSKSTPVLMLLAPPDIVVDPLTRIVDPPVKAADAEPT